MASNLPMFTIITPTYERSDLLVRAIDSVCKQGYQEWEMIIIIDSPHDSTYEKVFTKYTDSRIRFVKNQQNIGANASRNIGLESASASSTQIIFLDDDDYLSSGALGKLAELVNTYPAEKWLITNRVAVDRSLKTDAPQNLSTYHYAWDYLLFKKIKGDVTHCIYATLAKSSRFSSEIMNGEEWLYFFSLGMSAKPFYIDTDITLTDGYAINGLNFRPRSTWSQLRLLPRFVVEARLRRFILNPYFLVYLGIRALRAFIK